MISSWVLFALASALAVGFYRIVNRAVMRKEFDPYAYGLLINLFGAVITLPFVFSALSFPTDLHSWIIIIASSITWSFGMVIANYSYKFTPLSRREPFSQTELVFVLLLSSLFIGETITVWKIGGVALIITGCMLLSLRSQKALTGWRTKGVRFTLVAAFLFAAATILDKTALKTVGAGIYAFLLYLVPALLLILFVGKRGPHVSFLLKKKWRWVVLASFLSVASYYAGLRAFALADASAVYPILKLGSLITVLGGIWFFHDEREHVGRKIIAAACVILGAVLIAGSPFW